MCKRKGYLIMSYGSYTSLDSLAANGIIDFDANSYLTGAPPRYAGKLYSNNSLPYQQPLMDMYSPYAMAPGIGYSGGGLGPMNGYQGPWSSVQPEHSTRNFAPSPQMHAQPHQDTYTVEKSHDIKSAGGWIAGITAGIVGLWGITKFMNAKHTKKINKAKKIAAQKAKKIALNLEDLKSLKGLDKVKGWFRNTGKKLQHAPKWVKVTGIVALGAAGVVGFLASITKNRYVNQGQQQAQYPQQAQY